MIDEIYCDQCRRVFYTWQEADEAHQYGRCKPITQDEQGEGTER
jgi:hypothetical protein